MIMSNKNKKSPIIFELSQPGRIAKSLQPHIADNIDLPTHTLRQTAPLLPEISELQAVRHFTRLSQRNFSIDTQFYHLGSCTMKYNPRGVHKAASLSNFINRHPLTPVEHSQSY